MFEQKAAYMKYHMTLMLSDKIDDDKVSTIFGKFILKWGQTFLGLIVMLLAFLCCMTLYGLFTFLAYLAKNQ